MRRALTFAFLVSLAAAAAFASSSTLPDGTEFPSWEKPLHFSKTYYVDGQAKNADDKGPGTKERPFRTINHAAQVLQPGERVVIAEGVYRECVRPARGGTGPEAMISYEAAPGAKVVRQGLAPWSRTGIPARAGTSASIRRPSSPVKAWELRLDPALFPQRLQPVRSRQRHRQPLLAATMPRTTWRPTFAGAGWCLWTEIRSSRSKTPTSLPARRRARLNFFTEMHWSPLFKEFSPYAGKVWIETNGMTLHIRLANDDDPAKHTIEITTAGAGLLAGRSATSPTSASRASLSARGQRIPGAAARAGLDQPRQSLHL